MRLSYHRVSDYPSLPTLEVTEHEILNGYRVGGWQCQTLLDNFQLQPEANNEFLKKNFGKSAVEHSISRQVRAIERTPSILREVGQIHNANIQRSLAHRIQVAKERNDEKLLQALELELRGTASL